MLRRAMKPEALPASEAYSQEQCWTYSQDLQEMQRCRKLLRASNLLFSTFDTSTSKTGFSKPLIAGLVGTATRKSEHSTRLSGCKQGMGGSKSGVFPEGLHH